MKYMGSKNRIAKHLLPIMLENRNGRTWVEPFVGGANMIDKVGGKRIGADFNDYLIAMWKELQNGWIPPDFVSEEDWRDVKTQMENKYEKHYIAFVRLGCSFGADWNGGYARNVRKDKPNAELLNSTTKSYCGQSKRNILKQLPNLQSVEFFNSSYQDLEIPPNSLIYCDPPYEGTTKYKDDFNHLEFWEWCRIKAKEGHLVYVSEYNAPKDFECVYSSEINNTLNNTAKTTKATEKLFVHCG
jgi:DNA adenine methylase